MKPTMMLTLLLIFLAIFITATADIEVHYLDVGNADATVIVADGYAVLIDGGEGSSSQFLFSYLRNTLHLEYIDIAIATHPHADHIGGLSAAFNACSIGQIYSSVPMYKADGTISYDSREFQSLVKYASEQGLEFLLPSAGDAIQLGKLSIEFLTDGCSEDISTYTSSQINDLSLMVRIVYDSASFLFTGDAEWAAECSAITNVGDALQASILHAGHHGSRTSSNLEFLQAVQPDAVIISCGRDNPYGHPSEETLSRFQRLSIPVFRTDLSGTIIARSDGKTISFESETSLSTEPVQENPASDSPFYIGNRNSKRFHYPQCPSVLDMKEKNKVLLDSREEAIEKGYTPCGNCHP